MSRIVTKADIRAEFEAKPEKYAGLSPRQQNSIVSRGQAAEAAIKVYNKGRRPHLRYVRGNGGAAKAQTAATRQSLVSQGIAVGQRGPLSKAALAALKG